MMIQISDDNCNKGTMYLLTKLKSHVYNQLVMKKTLLNKFSESAKSGYDKIQFL